MKLSVIILNYKVPYYLLQCLQSVEKAIQHISAEIIVIDNNSKDESCQLVKQYFPNVILVQNKENTGFSKGNNAGIMLARGEYICLLNPDTVVGESVFQDLLKFAETKKDIGAVGVKIIDGAGSFLPESKRNLPTPLVALEKLFGIQKNYYSALKENETGKVAVLVGAFMLMKKDRYWEIGGLDEDYFMYGEDIDLSYKFSKAGYQNYYVGSTTVLHYKGESTAKDEKYRKRFYGAMKIFYQKHFQKTGLLNPLLNLGLGMAKIFHSTKKKEKTETAFKNWYWVSSQNVPKPLNIKLDNSVVKISAEEIQHKNIQHSKLIFDGESMTYQEILNTMEKLKMMQNSFRIKPENFNFMVGSDHSKHQGEILKF